MTLVELLVVIAVMVLLLAVSVPIIKPMLESRKTHDAAKVLAGAFKHAQTKSIKEGKSYGIKLVPFATAQTVSLQFLTLKVWTIDSVNLPNDRVIVKNGVLVPCRFDGTANNWVENRSAAASLFEDGDLIQFNYVGRSFGIREEGGNFKLFSPGRESVSYDDLNLPDDPLLEDAMVYRITRTSDGTLAWLPPVVMPQGTVVDIVFSGGEVFNFSNEEKTSDDIPPYFSYGDEVVVMFSPAGHVDKLFINGMPVGGTGWNMGKVNEMLYFCVGDWDRQVDINGVSLADDRKTNLQTPSTYWVTLHPKTGGTRITENAPIRSDSDTPEKRLRDARKFAREHFFNVGN